MEDITLSVFDHGQAALDRMRDFLSRIESQHGLRVRLEIIPWESGWQKLVEYALYRGGPDISEIGSTWTMDFVRMYELRPFNLQEANNIEGMDKFFEASWISGRTADIGETIIWAIPWNADPRIIIYRRDLLEKGGVDESAAFASARKFDETISRLKVMGIAIPLALPTSRSRRTIHNLASWIWEGGGDFLTGDHEDVAFDQKNAIQGIKAYFRLGRYLNDEAYSYDDNQADEAFWSGKAAVTVSGHWILEEARMDAKVRKNLGIAPVLGVPFVGGSHLVIWKHSARPDAALRLTNLLTNDPLAESLHPGFGLPVRESRWNKPPFNTASYSKISLAIKKGHSFPVGPLWGLVEKRLVDTLPEIWKDVSGKPVPEIDGVVQTKMDIVTQRLRMALKG